MSFEAGGKGKLEARVVLFPKGILEARKIISDAFKEDPDFKFGYQSNIAMLLYDRYGVTDYDTRNAIADDILKLIFEN